MRTLIGVGERKDGLYYFRDIPRIRALTTNKVSSSDLRHRRIGNPSAKVVQSLPFFVNSSDNPTKACDVCHQVKQLRNKFVVSDSRSSSRFEIIHFDLWEKYHTPSSCGATYFLTLVDDFSKAVWVYLLFDKNEVFKMFRSFLSMIERQFEAKVKVVRGDNGTEFNCMREYFAHKGILFQTSFVDTPQQNGRVKRKHRHILNVVRALLFQANLSLVISLVERPHYCL